MRVDTGKPLVDPNLLARVQAVELDIHELPDAPRLQNTYLLQHLVRCAACGRAMAGYTDSKYKVSATGEKVCYKYRKYRCAGRVNKPGGCKMPKLSADKLEQVVAEAVFADTARTAPRRLLEAVRAAVETRREQLTRALGVLASQRQRLDQDRDEALDGLLRLRELSPLLRQALSDRAEAAVQALNELLGKEKVLQVGLETLDHQARTIERVLQQPNLDPARWQEPTINHALQRALQVMVRRIEVVRVGKGNYTVRLWLPEAEDLLFRQIDKNESTRKFFRTKMVLPRRLEYLRVSAS